MSDKTLMAKCDLAAAHLARAYARLPKPELAITMHTNNNDLRYLSVIFPESADRNSVGLMLQQAGKMLMDGEV